MRLTNNPLLVLLTFIPAQGSIAQVPTAIAEQVLSAAPSETVQYDRTEDGTLWALGMDWKMRFSTDRTTYHPRFGSRAPRTPTLDVSLVAATLGGIPLTLERPVARQTAEGDVEYDRGVLLERWELAPRQVEQTFVLDRPIGAGELVLEFGGTTDVVPTGVDADGMRFAMTGVGEIRYGNATSIDAAGRRAPLPTTYDSGRIVLRIPAADLERASYPLVIDPLITNITIAAEPTDDFNPDAAFGLSSYLVVYEHVFSATDHDIVSRRFDDAGNFLETLSVDFTNENTVDPAVAAHGSSFMIVWNQLADGSLFSDNVIRGRRRIETTGVQAAAFDISTGANNETKPDVGGSPNLVSRPFFVVWSEDPVIGPVETHGRAIDELGNSLGSDVNFGAGNLVDGARISKSAGAAGRYLVCWETLGTQNRFLDAQMVSEGGSKLGSLQIIETVPLANELHADVDGDGTNWLVVREDLSALGDIDIIGTFLAATGPSTYAPVGSVNLTKFTLGTTETADQTRPAVGSEGCRFTFAFQDPEPLVGTKRVSTASVVASMGIPFQILVVDSPATHGLFGATESDIGVVSTQFKHDGDVLLTWSRPAPSSSGRDVEGALRSTLLPGGIVSTVQTGCGTPEPVLLPSTAAAVGGDFGLLIGNASGSTALLAVGTHTAPIALCSGQAPGCQLGVNILTMLSIPTIVSAQLPCTPTLLGFTVALQAFDVLPPSALGTFCGPPKYTQKFKVSDTVLIKFQ